MLTQSVAGHGGPNWITSGPGRRPLPTALLFLLLCLFLSLSFPLSLSVSPSVYLLVVVVFVSLLLLLLPASCHLMMEPVFNLSLHRSPINPTLCCTARCLPTISIRPAARIQNSRPVLRVRSPFPHYSPRKLLIYIHFLMEFQATG